MERNQRRTLREEPRECALENRCNRGGLSVVFGVVVICVVVDVVVVTIGVVGGDGGR